MRYAMFGDKGDYIRKYDFIHPSGEMRYTIIIWKNEWVDMYHHVGYLEWKRDEIFDGLCSGVHSPNNICVGPIRSQLEPPNMTDHRIGERASI